MTVIPTPLIAVVGPTASGKSSLALEVAQTLGTHGRSAEIVGTDSMQAYRGMDIGTATPSQQDQNGIPHHMVNIWQPSEAVSVVEFRDRARVAIDDIRQRGATALVVGGSGLYVRAVLEQLDFPGTDPKVRIKWEHELEQVGAPALHAKLAQVDPKAAASIEVNNGRRIVRALEVIELTGGPFIATLPEPVDEYPTTRFGLRIDRDVLDARIEHRVEEMWHQGFVDEVRQLEKQGLRAAPTASAALGYGPILDLLAGEITEIEAMQQTIDDTRKFARRQQRWFARDDRIHWWDYDSPDLAPAIVESVTST
jgi:tRNA dimethylallyltransferase